MGGFKLTGLAAGSQAGNSVRYEQILQRGTQQATTSGTGVTFTGIPTSASVVAICLNGISTDTAIPLLRLGTSSGIEITGYLSASAYLRAATQDASEPGSEFAVVNTFEAAGVYSGTIILTLLNAATFTWSCMGLVANTGTAEINMLAGRKSTVSALDRITIMVDSGAFDAGAANILYW